MVFFSLFWPLSFVYSVNFVFLCYMFAFLLYMSRLQCFSRIHFVRIKDLFFFFKRNTF